MVQGGELLTLTKDVKVLLEVLLNLAFLSSVEEAEVEDSEGGSPITWAEISRAVGRLRGAKAPGVNEVRTECRNLDSQGLSWLTNARVADKK